MISTELVVPNVGSLIPPGFVDEARAYFEQLDDLAAADDMRRRLAGLETYLRGKEAKEPAQAAARWGEVRIGELLGEPERTWPGKHNALNALNALTPQERTWFRKMAAHCSIVEDCLAGREVDGSTGPKKTSRAAILNEITKRTVQQPALPDNTYRAIVIDPPWPMPKIERHERPNQDKQLDYPTMSLDEIEALDIKDLADPAGTHIYLWVTHKYLPAGLDLLAQWGFRYQCVMTWRKNVGITPFSWMYDTEHVLFGRTGDLPLMQNGLRLCFEAPTQGHSIKPGVFYDRVRQASPGPRLDMFPGVEHDGFEPWGLEVSHRVDIV